MDLYKVLDVPKHASQADIKSAFRQLALQYHPDRHVHASAETRQDAASRFKAATEAYEVLGDERQRRAYDMRHSTHWRASNSSTYNTHVNRDWSTQGYSYTADSSGYTSRAGWWQMAGRVLRNRMRGIDAAAQGVFVMFLGGGLLFAAYGSTAVWDYKNRGKQFKDISKKRQL